MVFEHFQTFQVVNLSHLSLSIAYVSVGIISLTGVATVTKGMKPNKRVCVWEAMLVPLTRAIFQCAVMLNSSVSLLQAIW